MKRSRINELIRSGQDFFNSHQFYLPMFAQWSPDDWQEKSARSREIIDNGLGWDITDFGSDDFDKIGLFLFTVRNGISPAKAYAEKIMIVQENQRTPAHFHFQKTEDIINRGGGRLVLQLWNSQNQSELANTHVEVSIDGERVSVAAGGIIELVPGQSITLTPFLAHAFWGKAGSGTVLVGEVSSVNDDQTDNHFIDAIGRFPEIEEDEPAYRLLVTDYSRYF